MRILSFLREHLANILFPRACVGCGAPRAWLCESCTRNIHPLLEQECFVCRKAKTPHGEACFSCRKKSVLDGVFVAAPYRNRILSEAIHVFKYEFVDEFAPILGKVLAGAVDHSDLPVPDMIIPVPLHPWRRRYRGFNQSALLAEELAKRTLTELAVPVDETILLRTRFTLPQAKTHSAEERRHNLSGAFGFAKQFQKKSLRGKTVWLVDDVHTTGATLEECARILKKAGTKKVFGVVLAR
jgi:ComF family protein